MRGIVFDGQQAQLVADLEVRDPGDHDVVVRIEAAGVCHSDLSVVNGTIPFPPPVVLGHEGAGVVEAVGAHVTSVRPGDHVVLTTLGNCGSCGACETGHPVLCKRGPSVLAQPFRRGDDPLYSFANTSVFTERTVVLEQQVVLIDPEMPLATASLLGCGVLTGAGAVFNRAQVRPGDRVVVFGIGGIGLNVLQAASAAGATTVVAVDALARKESLARQFGATEFVDASSVDSVAAVREITGGGVDHAFECVGHVGVLRNAIDVLDWGGQCVILGVPAATAEASFVVSSMYHDKSILGCRYGSARPHHDIPMLVALYRAGKLKLDELVTRTYPLEDFSTVFEDMEKGELARGVLTI